LAKTYALEVDSGGIPVPQYENAGATDTEAMKGTNGAIYAGGDEAHDAADDGNPIKIGGKAANSAPTAVSAGDRVNAYFDLSGRLVVLVDQAIDTELPAAAALADGTANPTAPTVGAAELLYNGATFDRKRGNLQGALLASAARAETQTGADQTNYNGRGLHIILDVTAITDTPSIVLKIQGKSASGVYYDLLEGVAVTGTGTHIYKVMPWATAEANVAVADMLPRTWRVVVTHADADSITYSVDFAIDN